MGANLDSEPTGDALGPTPGHTYTIETVANGYIVTETVWPHKAICPEKSSRVYEELGDLIAYLTAVL
jgi:hypothetical protein